MRFIRMQVESKVFGKPVFYSFQVFLQCCPAIAKNEKIVDVADIRPAQDFFHKVIKPG